MPPYYNNIPQATDRISQSQGQILANFAELQTAFSANHVSLGTALPPDGQHNVVSYALQAPGFAIPAVANIYTYKLNSTLTAQDELYMARYVAPASPYNFDVPITARQYTIAPDVQGWTYLPSGMLMKWGDVNVVGGNAHIAFPAAATIPVFNQAMVASVVPYSAAANLVSAKVSALSATHIDIQVTNIVTHAPQATHVFYIVLGY